MNTLEGTITRILKKNNETGKFLADLRCKGSTKSRTVAGYSLVLTEGSDVLLIGEGSVAESYGAVFQAEETRVVLAGDTLGLSKYLVSAIKGLGETKAIKLVEAFDKEVLAVLEHSPEKIEALPGFGKKSATSLHENWLLHLKEGVSEKDLDAFTFLMRHGFTKHKATLIYSHYGKDCLTKLKLNPYLLCKDLKGFGFLTADKFALSLGVAVDSGYRLRAGILHLMEEALMEGSCGLSIAEIGPRGHTLMGVPASVVADRLTALVDSGDLIVDIANGDVCVFLPYIHKTEAQLASVIRSRLSSAGFLSNLEAESLSTKICSKIKLTLESKQKEGVVMALTKGLSVLTGPPGSGKTTILKAIVEGVSVLGKSIALCAPTGKAARRMEESVGKTAYTLHTLLKVRGNKFVYNSTNPLPFDFVVIDEFSMVDIFLAKSLFEAISGNTVVLVVGDHNQIPSIGPGRVLSSLINSKAIPVTLLDKIMRQAEGSGILKAAFTVNKGQSPENIKTSDFKFTNIEDPTGIHDYIINTVRDSWKIGFNPLQDVLVLSPMKKGVLGVDRLNVELQKLLNPFPASKFIHKGKVWTTYGVGDKVIHGKNDRVMGLMNGEVGFVTSTSEQGFTADFSGTVATYEGDNLNKVKLAYVITTHKAQGSEAKMIVMPVSFSHFKMLLRDLLYTGMTRARENLELVGEKKALWVSVKNNKTQDRYSRLDTLLKGGSGGSSPEVQTSLF